MSLCIIAPCKDSSPGPSRDALVNLAAEYTLRLGERPRLISSWRSSNIADVRQKLAERALKEPSDLFLWCDDDIVSASGDLFSLIDANEDVVSGCYPQKEIGGAIVAGPTRGGERRGALVEIDVAGFGFLLMRRHVLEALASARAFDCAAQADRVRGEDEAFSRWWRTRGGRMWLHTGVMLGHVGQHIFRGAE